ncbi:MAG: hypothetical protein ACI8RD_009326 [Bacillariaceae sp.]|jgi:hypothetical protein
MLILFLFLAWCGVNIEYVSINSTWLSIKRTDGRKNFKNLSFVVFSWGICFIWFVDKNTFYLKTIYITINFEIFQVYTLSTSIYLPSFPLSADG